MKKSIMKYIKKKRTVITSTASSVVSIILAILATLLYNWIFGALKEDSPFAIKCIFAVVSIVITIVVIYLVSLLSEYIKGKIWPENFEDEYMKHAFLHIRKLGANRQESFHKSQRNYAASSPEERMMKETMQNMQLVVDSCYAFFESAFSTTGQLVDDISFESTFMTKSYIDQKITIPCSANKENRTPISMLHRSENPDIFDNTETAKIYELERPVMILVENTEDDEEYAEIYANQKSRIKSSVILPVLSHENALLGTLVVHCNQAGFFKNEKYDFWKELLEMFSVEIGYQKLLLDYYVEKNSTLEKPF